MTTDGAPAGYDPGLVRTLRDAAPYLLAHRDRSVVVHLPAALTASPGLASWMGDITLLQHVAGMRFALAFAVDDGPATQPLDEQRAAELRAQADHVRQRLESLLSLTAPGGLAGRGTVTGNPLPSHTAGVRAGVDLGRRGVPKAIPASEAAALLGTGKTVLLSPTGAGHENVRLHLDAIEVAHAFAAAGPADKLVLLVPPGEWQALSFREITLDEARAAVAADSSMSDRTRLLRHGVEAIEAGVDRVHFLRLDQPGSMLQEFLSPDGIAAMISRDRFDAVRAATDDDAGAIIELIAPGVAAGALRPRSLEQVRDSIGSFAVVSRDESLVACANLDVHGATAEFGCLAVRRDYSNLAYGKLLLDYFEQQARTEGVEQLAVVTTRAVDWFLDKGFEESRTARFPSSRQHEIDARNAKVLVKVLSASAR